MLLQYGQWRKECNRKLQQQGIACVVVPHVTGWQYSTAAVASATVLWVLLQLQPCVLLFEVLKLCS